MAIVAHARIIGHATTALPQEMIAGRATTSPVPHSPTSLRPEYDSVKQTLATLAASTRAVKLRLANATRPMLDRAARSSATSVLKTGDKISAGL